MSSGALAISRDGSEVELHLTGYASEERHPGAGDAMNRREGIQRAAQTALCLLVMVVLTSPALAQARTGVRDIAGGSGYTIAACTKGAVVGAGVDYEGQLGAGFASDENILNPVRAVEVRLAVMVDAVPTHALALTKSGVVWAWGENTQGQLGRGDVTFYEATPAPVPGLNGAVAVAAGYDHSLALDRDGRLWGWGGNWAGQLGDPAADFAQTTPFRNSLIKDIVAIAAGGYHTLALKADGTVWAFGVNTSGELGLGFISFAEGTPQQVVGLSNVVVIGAGTYHSLAVTADGAVWGWGENYYGQVGDGNSGVGAVPTPVQVLGLANVVAVDGGEGHSLALLDDGTVWAWGRNDFGQLGDGTNVDHPVAATVAGLPVVTDIAAGAFHSLAIDRSGRTWAWGENYTGDFGTGDNVGSNVPVEAGFDESCSDAQHPQGNLTPPARPVPNRL